LITSPSSVAAGRAALALAAQPPAQLLEMVGDHDETPKGDAEQDHRDDVSSLELEELERRRARALVPAELLVGEVQKPGRDKGDGPDGHEPQDQGGHHRLGPGPLEVPDERLEALDVGPGSLLESPGNETDRELHRSHHWR